MKKSLLSAAVLCGTMATAPAMAEDVAADFHALSAMSSPVPAMTETQMSSVEGGILFITIGGLLITTNLVDQLNALSLAGLTPLLVFLLTGALV